MNKKAASVQAFFLIMTLSVLQPACTHRSYPDGLYAELLTNRGEIVLRLAFEKTPMTSAGFVGLAEGTIHNEAFPEGTPYYDGSIFHRVVPEHVIQAGAPPVEGKSGPGYVIPNEIAEGLSHKEAGILGMANGGPHTNGSQFYITLGDRSYLDGDYTVFGRVHAGMPVVRQIEQGDVIERVRIVRVGRAARNFHPDTLFFNTLVDQVKQRIRDNNERKQKAETAAILGYLPDADLTGGGIQVLVQRDGKGPEPKPGERMVLSYSGKTLLKEIPFVSLQEGRPGRRDIPQPFDYTIGETRINPGFDQGVENLRKGEKRLLIVPAGDGYGDSGFYGAAIEGRKRFVISPGTSLVYEVERLEEP